MAPRGKVPALLIVAALAAAPAAAQQVGVATAVNPMTESTPPGAATVTLDVGAHIVHNERIHTTPSGTVQLLFLDKSTMSIGPNTNILIDEYVYNPDSGNGHMLVSLAQGALRFVGGKLSHEGAATVTTPAASIGIRGGTATIIFDHKGLEVIDDYGIITIHNGAGTMELRRPGFLVHVLNSKTPPGQPERVTDAETLHWLEWLTSKFGEHGGVTGLHTVQIGDCGVGPLSTQATVCPQPPWINTGAGESDAFQLIIQATQQGTAQMLPPRRRGR